MLSLPDYRAHWARKRSWYERHGFTKRLIATEESPGLDSPAILEIIDRHFT